MKMFWKKFFDFTDDVLAYVLTIVGILCSSYVPLLKSGESFSVEMNWWKVAVAAVVALMIVSKQETLEIDESGSKSKSREGRKKRFALRMFNALSQGIAWNQIIQLAT